MATGKSTAILRHIDKLVTEQKTRQHSDRELLQRFARHGDEAAFAAILQRHGTMVLQVCRRLLADPHDADDAFQATFLVLLRRASGLRWRDSVGGWLHEVAYRVALETRKRRRKRDAHEARAAAQLAEDPADNVTLREAQVMLHEELHGLPERLRAPLVLCYLEGTTQDEAAGHLGWSVRTLKRRLQQGRTLLHARLTRRGLTLTAALSASLLAGGSTSAALTRTTLAAAASFVTGGSVTSSGVSAVVTAVARGMILAKLRATGLVVLVLLLGTALALNGSGMQTKVPPRHEHDAPNRSVGRQPKAGAARPESGSPVARTDRYGDPLPPEAVARLGTLRFRCEDAYSLAFTPNGTCLISGARGARVWDVATGKLVRHLGPELSQSFYPIDVSPDGKLVAVGGWGKTKGGVVYEIASGRRLYRFGFPGFPVAGLFSPDGKILAAYPRNDGDVVLLDAVNGRELRAFKAQHFGSGPILAAVAFTPDSKAVISADDSGFIRMWDVATGRELRKIKAHSQVVGTMVLAPDGKTLATVGVTQVARAAGGSVSFPDSPVALWDLTTGAKKLDFQTPADQTEEGRPIGPAFLRFSPDGKALVTGGWSQALRVWDAEKGELLRVLDPRPRAGGMAVAFAPSGKTLAITEGLSIRLLDFVTGREVGPALGGHRRGVHAVACSPDGRTIATGGAGGNVILWDAAGTERRLAGHARTPGPAVHLLAFSTDGATLFSAGRDKTFRAWDTATGRPLRCLKREEFESRPALTADGRTLAVENAKHDILLLDAATGLVQRTLKGRGAWLANLRFTPDGGHLLSWTTDGKLHRWNTKTGEYTGRDFYRLENASFDFVLSPDGKLVSFGVQNNTFLPVVDLGTGREVCRFPLDKAQTIVWIAFSPDSRMLAWGGPRGTVTIGEIASGKVRRQLLGHHGGVSAVAWSTNGKRLISGGEDTTALVWDLTLPATALTDADLAACWRDLASPDAALAYQSLKRLVADPDRAAAYLAKQLQPAAKLDPRRVRSFLAQLEDKQFAEREKAARGLLKLGDGVVPFLRVALERKPSLEARLRIERLITELERLGAEDLREVRAVEGLESMASPAARELLQRLIEGEPGARMTREARGALERLRETPHRRPQ